MTIHVVFIKKKKWKVNGYHIKSTNRFNRNKKYAISNLDFRINHENSNFSYWIWSLEKVMSIYLDALDLKNWDEKSDGLRIENFFTFFLESKK
ncbi:unnamed protein product [Rhizophagus irregularis]|nr:unnamed protein product [Rhizophagus irregularis]